MKKTALLLLTLLSLTTVMAQSPRAVIKSIVDGDQQKAQEKLEKINLKTRNEMPEMCILVEAALLSMESQSDENKLRGYEMLATHIGAIRSSIDIEKTFKGSDITFDELVALIEKNSLSVVMTKDDEATYRSYIALAKRGEHSNLESVATALEENIYKRVMSKRSVDECSAFLDEFPQSKHSAEVDAHRTSLRYDEAMATTNEAIMEQFISDFPQHEKLDNVATRLMEHRYKRVVRSENINEMRWFVDRYPNYHDMDNLKQMMANMEYPTLKDSREALEAFVDYYPKVRQTNEAKSRIAVFNIIEGGDIGKIFQYIKSNGYDHSYPRMQRSIFEKHGYLILTPDINTVELVRFRTMDGKVGYLGLDGKVVAEPQYELKGYIGLGIQSIHSNDIFECTKERGVAMVIKDGKIGVINRRGELIIPAEYSDIAFLNTEIICSPSGTQSHGSGTYTCNVYDYDGKSIATDHEYNIGPGSATFNNWDTTWFNANVTLKDSLEEWVKNIYVDGKFVGSAYGGFHPLTAHYRWFQAQNDDKINVISRNGEITSLTFQSYDIEVIYNNIIMAESISSGNRCVIDLDKRQIISKDKFRDMWAMSDGMILVQYLDNSFGYVDSNLNAALNQRYNRAYSFSCGTAAVIVGSQAYLIDKSGKQISSIYDDIAPLSGYKGLYKVMRNGKCGIIDANDEVVVAIEHEPIKQSHYSSDKLQSIHCTNGIIEWGDGSKTLIFSK